MVEYNEPYNLSENIQTRFIDVAVTSTSCSAIDENGNIWSWGYQSDSEDTIASNHVGVLGNGNSGEERLNELTQVTNGVKYVQIDGGTFHIVAKDEDNYLWSWGSCGNGSRCTRHRNYQ